MKNNMQSAIEIRTAKIEAGKVIRLAVKPRAA